MSGLACWQELRSRLSSYRRTGRSFRSDGGADSGDGGKIAFRRTTDDSLCIPGQKLASKCSVQSLIGIGLQGSDDPLNRCTVERNEVGIAVHKGDPISVHTNIRLIASHQHAFSIV